MKFKVENCPNCGCNFWRPNDQCAKNGMTIKDQIPYTKYLHYSDFCQVRRQTDMYRLNQMLEE